MARLERSIARSRGAIDALTYMVSGGLQKTAHLLLIPLIIDTLSPADFARYGLFTSLIALLPRIISLNLHSAPTRLVFDYESAEDRADLLNTTLLASLGAAALALLLMAPFFRIVPVMDVITGRRIELEGGIALVVMFSISIQFALAVARVYGRARLFAVASLLQSFGIVALYAASARFLEAGFPVVVSVYAIVLGIVGVGGLYAVRTYWAGGQFRPHMARAAVRFAAPTVVSFLAVWIIGSSGRWVGASLLGLDAIAAYVLLTFMVTGVGILGRALFDAALPAIGTAFGRGQYNEGDRIIRRTTGAACMLVAVAYGAAAIALWWVGVPVPSTYIPSAPLLGVAFIASLSDCLYLYGMQTLTALKRTHSLAGATMAAAVSVLGLSILLTRAWASLGLITATAAGIAILALFSFGLARFELSRARERDRAQNGADSQLGPAGPASSHPAQIWALLMTPLQVRHMARIGVTPAVVFFTPDVPNLLPQIERAFPTAERVRLPANRFSRSAALHNPLSAAVRGRRLIRKARARIAGRLMHTHGRVELWCGHDRNVYTQLIARMLARSGRLQRVVAVDEGVGYYLSPRWSRYVWRPIYAALSPLVLGFRYDHVGVLGSWPLVTEIWLRWPERTALRRQDVAYRKIPLATDHPGRENSTQRDRRRILLISSPLATDRLLRSCAEAMLLREVIDGAIASGYDVAIKPHPRDPAMKFADYADRARISILDSSRCAEDIDYWSYDLILNFGSSVVMEVLASGYPAHDILTIEVGAGLTRRLDLLSVTVICHDVAEALRIMKDRSRPTSPAGLG